MNDKRKRFESAVDDFRCWYQREQSLRAVLAFAEHKDDMTQLAFDSLKAVCDEFGRIATAKLAERDLAERELDAAEDIDALPPATLTVYR